MHKVVDERIVGDVRVDEGRDEVAKSWQPFHISLLGIPAWGFADSIERLEIVGVHKANLAMLRVT